MIKNYFKIAWRTLIKNRTSSFINISGLTVGMAVAMVIGLWIWDELSFDQYHRHYDRIALVMVRESIDGNTSTSTAIPWPLDAEMRKNYGSNFKHIVMMSWTEKHVLSIGDKKI